MSRQPAIVIVGANLTGGAAATTLRSEGFEGPIVMIGEEPNPPYERPPLSKEYLRGDSAAEGALLHPATWYQENDVELRLGIRADRIDRGAQVVCLDDEAGTEIPFDRVLVATGGRNRMLAVPGHGLEGVHALRTIEEADVIRGEATTGRKAVVVGAGFIGCEVAASLRQLGVEIEVVEIFGTALQRALGSEIGSVFEAMHRDHGVVFHFGQEVERFLGAGRVEEAVTDRGLRIGCDFVVVGIGIEPNIELVERTDVEVDNGILVDEFCRTNLEGVYAAGDVANHWHPLFDRRVRVEHWDNALKQGAAAARSMMGKKEPYDDPHWFWSDQYDQNLQSIGLLSDWDELVVRGSLEERDFLAFYLKEGVLMGAVGLGRGKHVRRCGPLIRARRPLDPVALKDEDVDLKRLAASFREERAEQ
ncbi:MAG TPA: FAD-dependent oxidoreductase [Actinomycetota bacterium]|nr:FAD-dependent oxidoreductase [Actinomycetota bacterium]